MRKTDRFSKGSGCYPCRCCGRKTRSTGRGDNENLELCSQCYDLTGIENSISDNGSTPELETAAKNLREEIRALGGVL